MNYAIRELNKEATRKEHDAGEKDVTVADH